MDTAYEASKIAVVSIGAMSGMCAAYNYSSSAVSTVRKVLYRITKRMSDALSDDEPQPKKQKTDGQTVVNEQSSELKDFTGNAYLAERQFAGKFVNSIASVKPNPFNYGSRNLQSISTPYSALSTAFASDAKPGMSGKDRTKSQFTFSLPTTPIQMTEVPAWAQIDSIGKLKALNTPTREMAAMQSSFFPVPEKGFKKQTEKPLEQPNRSAISISLLPKAAMVPKTPNPVTNPIKPKPLKVQAQKQSAMAGGASGYASTRPTTSAGLTLMPSQQPTQAFAKTRKI